ncbi:MAG: hypothetical protein IJ754_08110 [Bacteroidaceae bacterium]|nr:hypothetical protein [Bacteroidaceae bacterium]
MNNSRRKAIEDVINTLSELSDSIGSVQDEVSGIYEEELEAYQNLPDGIRESEKGDTMTSAMESLESVDSFFCRYLVLY